MFDIILILRKALFVFTPHTSLICLAVISDHVMPPPASKSAGQESYPLNENEDMTASRYG